MPYYREAQSDWNDVDPAEFGPNPLPANSPGVVLEPCNALDFQAASPHDATDQWQADICAVFGTRHRSTAKLFLDQLVTLCSVGWDRTNQRWKPNETELNFALSLIASVRPRNAMEAALAAQMVAVHFMQVRMSAQALGDKHIEPRDAAVAGKLALTFSTLMETLENGRRRGRSSRQHITVKQEKHVHHHEHRHVALVGTDAPKAAWGRAPTAETPSLENGEHDVRQIEQRAEALGRCNAMPGEDEIGRVVPLTRRGRKAGL